MGFFKTLSDKLIKTKSALGDKLFELFNRSVINDDFFDELECCLISADVGAKASSSIIEELRETVISERLKDTTIIKERLKDILQSKIDYDIPEYQYPLVVMMTGVNGTGKTTTVGKLASYFVSQGKKVMLAAADTFRAAASEQLSVWANRVGVRIVKHEEGSDPAAVVYDAIQSAKAHDIEVLLVDTAGRLHNKKNLMSELEKISRVVTREWAEADFRSYIVVDATVGQNALAQIDAFNESVALDGIVLTKLDGTAKGGVVIAMCEEIGVPVVYIGVGEQVDDLQVFDAKTFIDAII